MSDIETEVNQHIENLRSYLKELKKGNISDNFASERIVQLCKATALKLSRDKIDQKKLKQEYQVNTEAVELGVYRNELLTKVNQAFHHYGVMKTLKATNIGRETYTRLKHHSDQLRVETILDCLERIKKNESELRKNIAV